MGQKQSQQEEQILKIQPVSKKAYVIGISSYDKISANYKNLPSANIDAFEIMNVLKSQNFNVATSMLATLDVIKNPSSARKSEIDRQIQKFILEEQQAKQKKKYGHKFYFIYYSGRGFYYKETGLTFGIDSDGKIINFQKYIDQFVIGGLYALFFIECDRKETCDENLLNQIHQEQYQSPEILEKFETCAVIVKYTTAAGYNKPIDGSFVMSSESYDLIRKINLNGLGKNLNEIFYNLKPNCQLHGNLMHSQVQVFDQIKLIEAGYYDQSVYKGQSNFANLRNGFGYYKWVDQGEYEGYWIQGFQNGYGKHHHFPSGKIHQGYYQNGAIGKLGLSKLPGGQIIDGEFQDSKPHGYVEFYYAQNDRYYGSMKNGQILCALTILV
ncbi:UNKNOWN [Stylonychia lemnae]|uniref:Peptidase C14 caspase domain-containing protein n=1 Tax=Stylonychia lemnae TaxID=5949 RepID=A0A078AWA5_STYLE|nr:UNKNOWN [Stylonychia lemnae]|eukprot:CDW86750.1 UNKNOWN [Stylonychia lemnae]